MAGGLQTHAENETAPASDADGGPVRRCIVTGKKRPVAELLRFVVGPDDRIVPDLAAGLPGRGLWLSARRDVVNTASEKKLFAKAAKRKVIVPPDLADEIEAQMVRRCMDALGLARRAGQVVAGFEKANAWLRAARGGLLVAARDGGEDGKSKLRALAPGLAQFTVLDAAELGRALGRDHVVHAVVAPGRLADRLVFEQNRLLGFREGAPAGGLSPSQTDE
ncbi:MAG: hypothetical protein COW30_16665 [Rhodospirillales bacterium CG15_BIG_FIL_POST_REV_8_21_14_020_66_15]|nr:MAG: hypothetical protein COW30_16665 [Rhodospirillales bacterium CG15_BIG_FIL_POST_REV_8_21_14_020_66_15]